MATKELIGARVRRLRREKTTLNQAELARAIRIDPATLNQIEQGKRQPSAQTISRLAEFLGVSRDYLMDGAPTQNPAAPSSPNVSTEAPAIPETAAPRQGFDFSAAVSQEVYATLSTVFAQLAADCHSRSAAHADREAPRRGTAERPARVKNS
jgi:transcriptional regulator with XRE-family HTH domain